MPKARVMWNTETGLARIESKALTNQHVLRLPKNATNRPKKHKHLLEQGDDTRPHRVINNEHDANLHLRACEVHQKNVPFIVLAIPELGGLRLIECILLPVKMSSVVVYFKHKIL